jgi:hypothetical protein
VQQPVPESVTDLPATDKEPALPGAKGGQVEAKPTPVAGERQEQIQEERRREEEMSTSYWRKQEPEPALPGAKAAQAEPIQEEEQRKAEAAAEDTSRPVANTSGQGKAAIVPEEIKKWNWGAFLLNAIWGLGNGTYISLLTFVPYVGWVMAFILGFRGNEWAWQNKRWESVEHFQKTQQKWTQWGVGITIAFAVLGFFVAIVSAQ